MGILYFFLYLCFGALIMAGYSMVYDLDIPFSEDSRNTKEETSKQFLVWIGWPLYVVYLVIKAAIWFIKNLFLALKFFWDKYVGGFFKKESKGKEVAKTTKFQKMIEKANKHYENKNK